MLPLTLQPELLQAHHKKGLKPQAGKVWFHISVSQAQVLPQVLQVHHKKALNYQADKE